MARLGLTKIQELVFSAESNSEVAACLLEEIADILYRGEPLEDDLRAFLADAFSAAAKEDTPQERAATLACRLHITAKNRRPISSIDSADIAVRVEKYLADGISLNQAATNVMQDLGNHSFSESTIKREYIKLQELKKRVSKIRAQSDELHQFLSSWVVSQKP